MIHLARYVNVVLSAGLLLTLSAQERVAVLDMSPDGGRWFNQDFTEIPVQLQEHRPVDVTGVQITELFDRVYLVVDEDGSRIVNMKNVPLLYFPDHTPEHYMTLLLTPERMESVQMLEDLSFHGTEGAYYLVDEEPSETE